jgi:hypothetical protein
MQIREPVNMPAKSNGRTASDIAKYQAETAHLYHPPSGASYGRRLSDYRREADFPFLIRSEQKSL